MISKTLKNTKVPNTYILQAIGLFNTADFKNKFYSLDFEKKN